MSNNFWKNKRVVLTGHTGFKGGWLALWLNLLGAKLLGIGLAPTTSPSLFSVARVGEVLENKTIDIRDFDSLKIALTQFKPDIVFHLAAQPLVRYSYENPIETFSSNVMGLANLLELSRRLPSLKVFLNVTSDKCYENKEQIWSYREIDPLGGVDPYSSSKACAELVTNAYKTSFFKDKPNVGIATARAGNVIGGGDWSNDRLIPDVLKALTNNHGITIRNPDAIRPWQHVLEPLGGYLKLAENLFSRPLDFSEPWNFGPADEGAQKVSKVVEIIASLWGKDTKWTTQKGQHPREAQLLMLDVSKAKAKLGWSPKWSLYKALEKTVEWQRLYIQGNDMRDVCFDQISLYSEDI